MSSSSYPTSSSNEPDTQQHNMTLEQLLKLFSSENPPKIRTDSRNVKKGDIFIALKGTTYDGHDFIEKAIDNGAKYIICEQPYQSQDAQIIKVDDCAETAGMLAQLSRQNPAKKLTNLAVTGTNGKTTVAFLVRSCFQAAGQKCGLVGTVIYDTGNKISQANLTTPDCLSIAEAQQQMVNAGLKYMVIEASSHALAQKRLAAINFTAAAFTNLTGDHLDYHKTEKDYLSAKSVLFESLSSNAVAVLNKQSPHTPQIAKKAKAKIIYYAVDEPADLTANIASMDITGTCFVLEYAGQKHKVKTPLLGKFNVSNHLAAAGLCLAVGLDLKTIANGLSSLKTIHGRLEKIDHKTDFTVLIDYAHTDDALQNVLSTLQPLCKGRLIVVFGCGGDRDRTKRPRMAKVAEELADIVIVTSDNPRTEQPEYIIGEIVTGFDNPVTDTVIIELERKDALKTAIDMAQKNDVIIIAGKGHEDYQIIGNKKFPFSDKEIAEKYLNKTR